MRSWISFFVLVSLLVVLAGGCASPTRVGWHAYERGDYDRAVDAWTPLAVEGDADLQYLIGLIHDEGEWVDSDPQEAVAWYRRAAEQGHPAAQNNLGLCYSSGRGVAPSRTEAARWFARSAAQGFAAAKNNQGVLMLFEPETDDDQPRALALLTEAAEAGDPKAQMVLASIHAEGLDGEVDSLAARRWFELSAESGEVAAAYRLGLMFMNGEGVELKK